MSAADCPSPTATAAAYVATDGDGYERLMGRWSRRLAEPFLDFVGTRPGERVLDLGCGTGNLAMALLHRAPASVVGVDLAPGYVEFARCRANDPRLSFAVGNACALGFPDQAFDRVLALLLLHFVPDVDRTLAEMRRVARPGAVVGAAVWDNRGGFVAQRLFWDTAAPLLASASAQRARHCTRPMTRPGELAAAFEAAGFEDVTETVLSVRMDYGSFDDYWAPCEGRDGPIAAYVATLDVADRIRLRDAVRAAYVDGDPDGPRSYAALAWAAKAVAPH